MSCAGHWEALCVLFLSERMFITALLAALIHMTVLSWKLQSVLHHSLLQNLRMYKWWHLFADEQHIVFIPHAVASSQKTVHCIKFGYKRSKSDIFPVITYTLCFKGTCNLNKDCQILIIVGRNVAWISGDQMMLYFPTSPTASAVPGKLDKYINSVFSLSRVLLIC